MALPLLVLLASLLVTPACAQVSTYPAAPAVDPDRAALASGRAWSVGTGSVSIAANQQLDVTLANPAGSGCNATFVLRRYENTSNSDLLYTSYTNPTAITSGTSGAAIKTPANRRIGDAAPAALSFGSVSRASGAMGGTAGVSSPLLSKEEMAVAVPILVPPGATYGVSISGLTGALSGSVTVAVTFAGYCA